MMGNESGENTKWWGQYASGEEMETGELSVCNASNGKPRHK